MNTYNFDEILRSVSIEDVLNHYGIELKGSGNTRTCKLRNESCASCQVRLDQNTFADFGLNANGNVFNLVGYLEYGIVSSNENKLSTEDSFKISTFIGDTFGVNPASYTRDENGWFTLSENQYKQIGLYGDSAIKNLVDFRYQTIDEVNDLEQKYGALSMKDLAQSNKEIYIGIIEKRSLPFLFNKKKEYLLTVRSLAKAQLDGDNNKIEELTESAEKLYKEYSTRYQTLKRAVPPLTDLEKQQMGKEYAVNTRPYNVYPVDEAVKRYSNGKESVQFGNISNQNLKRICKARHENIVYIECSKEQTRLLAAVNPQFRYTVFDNGLANQDKVVVSEKDLQACLKLLKKNGQVMSPEVAKISASKNNLSEFGIWFEHYVIKKGVSKTAIAQSLGVDVRRLSEVMKANAKLSETQQNILEALKAKLGYRDYQAHSYTYAADSNNEYSRFTELLPEQKNEVINRLFNSPSNKTQQTFDGYKYSKEQIAEKLSSKYYNTNYVYDKKTLKQYNINQIKDTTQKRAPHSRSYADIKALSLVGKKNPYIVNNLSGSENLMNMFDDMKHADFPFYAMQDNKGKYMVAIIQNETNLDKFLEFSIKNRVDLSESGAQALIYRQQRVAGEMSLRDNVQYNIPTAQGPHL